MTIASVLLQPPAQAATQQSVTDEPPIESLRFKVGDVMKNLEHLFKFCDPMSRVRLEAIAEGGIPNPNLGETKEVSLFRFTGLLGKDEIIRRVSERGEYLAQPDVLISVLSYLSGSGDSRTAIRRSFLRDAGMVLCLETTLVHGSGPVNMHFRQDGLVGEAQRPFVFDYMNAVMRVNGSEHSVIVMKD